MNEQSKWIEKAKETHKFHIEKIRSQGKWTLKMTAKALKRSLGSICEDLLVARWLRTHATDLEKFDYMYEALEFIREKKYEEETEWMK